jgi:hypothetical protein
MAVRCALAELVEEILKVVAAPVIGISTNCSAFVEILVVVY